MSKKWVNTKLVKAEYDNKMIHVILKINITFELELALWKDVQLFKSVVYLYLKGGTYSQESDPQLRITILLW